MEVAINTILKTCLCSPVVKVLKPHVLRSRGSNLSSDASAYQRMLSQNSYAHDEQGDNHGQEKEGLMVSSINCDRF